MLLVVGEYFTSLRIIGEKGKEEGRHHNYLGGKGIGVGGTYPWGIPWTGMHVLPDRLMEV